MKMSYQNKQNVVRNNNPQPQPQPQQQQVQVIEGSNPLGLPSANEWNQIKDICLAAVKSGMLPTSIKTVEAASIIALKSRELGLPLMVGFSNIHVINGKPCMSAELIQSQARKNLPGLIFNIVKTDDKICEVSAQRPERGSTAVKVSFSIEDAKRAGLLTKDPWKNYPAAMLRARAITACLRVVCPDALMGVSYTPEELNSDQFDHQAIPTTSRPVQDDQQGGNVIDMSPPPQTGNGEQSKPVESIVTEPSQEDLLKKKRGAVWNMWKSGKGTQEGFAKYIKEKCDANSGADLLMTDLQAIEIYIIQQLKSWPPQPLDPETPQAAKVVEAWEAEGSAPLPPSSDPVLL
jgi:hypothetical protein